jgi:hypothetical protein
MATRYDIKPDSNGWTVYDTTTHLPAEVNGFIQIGLSTDDADDVLRLMEAAPKEVVAEAVNDATPAPIHSVAASLLFPTTKKPRRDARALLGRQQWQPISTPFTAP